MKKNRYSIVVLFRVILITLNCMALTWFFIYTDRPATTMFLFILLVFQTVSLILYLNHVNRDLANFLIFLQEGDTSLTYNKKIERNFKGLTYHLDKLNQKFRLSGIERELQFQYLQTIIKQVYTGIIACDQSGKVEIFNQAAEEILGIHSIHHINEINKFHPSLAGLLMPGNGIAVSPVKINKKGREKILAVKSGTIKFNNKEIKIISFQNIGPEMEAGELDAWRRLIRIQRHEIMNSITPITTLTTAIKRLFKKGNETKSSNEITDDQIEDALKSIDVIEERSLGLINFMERFKNLTDIPSLKKEPFLLKKLIDHAVILFSRELVEGNITVKAEIIPDDLIINADEKLLEQVIINLIKNSIEAINNLSGEILINAHKNAQNGIVIQVADNGTGIDKHAMENIFIPSYTTKEKGSGIGLSLIRQIVQLHHGFIEVRSEPGVRTVFEITFTPSSYQSEQFPPFHQ